MGSRDLQLYTFILIHLLFEDNVLFFNDLLMNYLFDLLLLY